MRAAGWGWGPDGGVGNSSRIQASPPEADTFEQPGLPGHHKASVPGWGLARVWVGSAVEAGLRTQEEPSLIRSPEPGPQHTGPGHLTPSCLGQGA